MTHITTQIKKKLRAFIVDDSQLICGRITEMLSEIENVEVVGTAAGVAEAEKAIDALHPDTVILDIQLLDGSGLDLLRRLKKPLLSPMVIMITNFPFPQYRQRSMEEGANFFLDKSTEFNKITEIITNAVRESEYTKA